VHHGRTEKRREADEGQLALEEDHATGVRARGDLGQRLPLVDAAVDDDVPLGAHPRGRPDRGAAQVDLVCRALVTPLGPDTAWCAAEQRR
jgi:hypothetical protein